MRRPTTILAALLALSGAAALIDQVVWVRLVALALGSTTASIAIVVATFCGGLALGGLWAPRWLARARSPFALLLLLETAIAASALLLLPVLVELDSVVAAVPVLAGPALRPLVAALLLAVPTTCMGATFPVAIGALERAAPDSGIAAGRIAHVYAWNTAGAVLGAAGAGFVLVPHLGLLGSLIVAAGANLSGVALGLVGHGAFRVQEPAGPGPRLAAPPATAHERVAGSGDPARRRFALLVLVFTGAVAIACELVWSRALGLFLERTLQAFALVLAVFLAGIAAGSGFTRRRQAAWSGGPARVLATSLCVLAAALAFTRAALALAPAVHDALVTRGFEPGPELAVKAIFVILALTPTTFAFGALYPLSIALASSGDGKRLARAYSLNTLAGVAGSLATGLVRLPRVGVDTVSTACVFATAGFAVTAVVRWGGGVRGAWRALPAFGLLLLPGHDPARAVLAAGRTSGPRAAAGDVTFLYLREGLTGTISVTTQDGRFARLANDGLSEAMLDLADPMNGHLAESLLGLVPALVHPAPRTAFCVGLGGGTTARALAWAPLEAIRVVELEPRVVEAVDRVTGGTAPALVDPRIAIEVGDARLELLVERERRYDVIVSQPSHPWLAGAGSLFTLEFFELARERLAPGGVFAAWLNLPRLERDTLRAVARAFFAAFPHGFTLFVTKTGDLVMIGSVTPIELDLRRIDGAVKGRVAERGLARYGVADAADLFALFGPTRSELLAVCADVEPNDDHSLVSEVRGVGAREVLPPERLPQPLLVRARGLSLAEVFSATAAPRALEELALRSFATDRAADGALLLEHLRVLDADRARRVDAALASRAAPVTPETSETLER